MAGAEATAAGGAGELPKEFVDHCTRQTRMEARVQARTKGNWRELIDVIGTDRD